MADISPNSLLDVYGEAFQINIIKLIIEKPIFFSAISTQLKSEHFSFKPAALLFEIITEHQARFHIIPDYGTLSSLINIRLGKREFQRDLTLQVLTKIQSHMSKGLELVEEKTIEFCKIQAFRGAMEEGSKFLETIKPGSNLDFSGMLEKFQNVNRINVETIDSGIMDGWDFMYQGEGLRRNVVSTGMRMLDYVIGGGMAAGELHTIAAFTNLGKTTFLINIGANIFMSGKKILHCTTENTQNQVKASYHSRVTNIPKRQFASRQKEAKEIWDKTIAETGAYLHVKEFAMGRHSLDSIENYHLRLKDQGFNPDIIIIDSPLHLLPKRWTDVERLNIGQVFQATRGFAQEYQIPILASAQLNREAAQKRDNGSERIGEAIQIAQVSDSLTTINRNDDDMAKGIAVLKNTKTREAKAGETWVVKFAGAIGKIVEFETEVTKRIMELEAFELQQAFGETKEISEIIKDRTVQLQQEQT